MRLIYFLLLVIFIAAIAVFAVQNKDEVTIKYLDRSENLPLPAVVGAAYLLGMFTGWTVVGLLKRSFQRVTERRG
jgi:lipopolysaccharide assembly protein A